jgi:DNA polymerase bacteriophage-type
VNDLEPLSTDPNDFVFVDVETRSTEDVTVHGAARHTAAGRVTILAYAIGDGPVKDWCVGSFEPGERLRWSDAPDDLLDALQEVEEGRKWFVAHNAGFEFNAFTRAMDGLEDFRVEWLIDTMVQAMRSHLPGDLAGAARAVGLTQKQTAGKKLIQMFAVEGNGITPQTHPEEWEQFRSYARDDVAATRDIFFATMPLTRREWAEYHAVERLNHRGVPVDVPFVRRAVQLSAKLTETSNADIARLTGGKVRTVNQSAALLDWIRYELRALPEVDRILTREVDLVEDEDGEQVRVPKMSLGRSHVEELIAYLERLDSEQGLTDEEYAVLQVLEVRLYGASATPKKYKKIEALVSPDGRVRGQYVFGGAAATGRMSGRGFQPQNLARAKIGTADDEADAIEMIAERGVACFDELRERWGPVGRTLSRLIRPAIVAPVGKAMVWADWSAIEARVLPWIAASEGGEEVLDVFRTNDKDKSLPDIYRIQAGKLLRKPATEVTGLERQSHGKVPVLALGFGGGKGALFAMARAYGASFTEDEASEIVEGWRRENKWAVRLWDQIWEAVLWCMENPGLPREAGRMTYVYDGAYRGGSLFGVLPCGRPLVYPGLRWAEVEQKNKQTGEVTTRTSLTMRQARARVPISHLTLTNNAVQGTAASLLRAALVDVEKEPLLEPVVVTHDEIVCLCDEGAADEAEARLMEIMLRERDWAAGLPVAAEATRWGWYSKAVGD